MIGIISAMQEEMQTLIESLQDKKRLTRGMRTYYTGVLFDKKVVLVFSRWGKVASATTTTQLINEFHPEAIIFTGVAGSVNDSLDIGDIVIGKHLYQYDVDARPFFERFEVPILGKKYFETNTGMRTSLEVAAYSFVAEYNDHVDQQKAAAYSIGLPQVFTGNIGSGDRFIATHEAVVEFNAILPEISCVEMEGAAVAQVCFEYDVPFAIIRIISDKANDNAHIEFQKFAHD
ncbi:MAG: 5'-methylthioadenosine/adenosylhomocysteine nucleosidase, partial [Flavobacteriaceae bacterium]|nr:5'-methylthioadenosine/adenosylhomocysteine nucleosidase [Flavobacteriaceae bacterium]